uniref:PHD-type domain-containing protein n=1 Tax=Amphimedon queenslandica TaxID=400682 RepID=A0A1X7VB86_AMPQE
MVARKSYEAIALKDHEDFKVKLTGLHVNINSPHLGASPDGLISCQCCGNGILEIKCPYSVRDGQPTECAYLKVSEHGQHELLKTHQYYYQIQGQMGIVVSKYTDFVCWTKKGIYIERIKLVEAFYKSVKEKLDKFFIKVILPKLLSGNADAHPSEKDQLFCFCRKGEYGKMIFCDCQFCKYGWFHFACVNITEEPVGQWYCPDCV